MTTMATYGNGPSARAREETESRRRGTRRNGETRKRAALRPLCCKSRISTYAIIGCKISSSSVIHRCTLLSVSLSLPPPFSLFLFPFRSVMYAFSSVISSNTCLRRTFHSGRMQLPTIYTGDGKYTYTLSFQSQIFWHIPSRSFHGKNLTDGDFQYYMRLQSKC